MPIINFGALQPVADNTGLSSFLESSLPPSSANGLGNPNPPQQYPSFTESFQSSYPNPRPGLPQPLRVDFKGKAESLYGQDIIQKFLNKLSTHSDENAAFQELVNEYYQESFDTPGNINPKMNEIMRTYEDDIIKLGRELLDAPKDTRKHNFSSNGFYGKLNQMAEMLRPRLPPAPEPAVAPPPTAADPPAWYKFWGGRKTALSRSRNRSGKKTRARKLKQRSRKRAVRRR
jgi:hypothetical protein